MDLLNNNELDSKKHIIASKASKSKVAELKQSVAELQLLCNNLDPYQPLNESQKLVLAKNGIVVDYENYDPFALTNKLILALEDALEELQSYGK